MNMEALKQKHAKELAEAERLQAVEHKLPKKPDHLLEAYNGQYWATFQTPTLAAVAAIVREFAGLIVPTVEFRDGCLYRLPLDIMPAKIRARAEAEGQEKIFSLETHQGRGFGPSVDFCFHASIDGIIVRIICKLPDNRRAGAKLTPPQYDRYGHPMGDGKAEPNLVLRSLFHDFISWSPTVRGQDARYTYTLLDDGPEYSETLNILENTEISQWWAK